MSFIYSIGYIIVRTGCESIETTVWERALYLTFAGFITRMSPGRISKHVMFDQFIVSKGKKREFNDRHKG